jgi:hypothetical protein
MIADRLTADGTYAHSDIVRICAFEMMKNSIVHDYSSWPKGPLSSKRFAPKVKKL